MQKERKATAIILKFTTCVSQKIADKIPKL